MELSKIKDGKIVNYKARVYSGRGRVIEVYRRANGPWVVVHDKTRNMAVTLRPSQIH